MGTTVAGDRHAHRTRGEWSGMWRHLGEDKETKIKHDFLVCISLACSYVYGVNTFKRYSQDLW